MDNKIKKYLYDIKESISAIHDFIGAKKDFNKYLKNKMLRRAVEREIEIIGVAIGKIDKLDSNIQISSKKQIVGMRNRVIHGYDKIDDEIVWGTIVKHLPILEDEIERHLNTD